MSTKKGQLTIKATMKIKLSSNVSTSCNVSMFNGTLLSIVSPENAIFYQRLDTITYIRNSTQCVDLTIV